MSKKLTKEEFVKNAKFVHGDKYDYSLVEYINNHTKVKIFCQEHGIFEKTPNLHISQKQGCPKCSDIKLSKEIFIKKSKEIYGNKYDYSLVYYKNNDTKVKIICPEHGVFEKTYINHIKSKQGCPICTINKISHTKEKFINISKIKHNNIYDYSLVDYKNNKCKVDIICTKHGVFSQRPDSHMRGIGCTYCNESKGEQKISIFLENNNILFERQKTFEKCKNIFNLPFDFYIKHNNTCIEFDGKQHFESIDFFGGNIEFEKLKHNDKIKNEYCKKNNIRLIRIKYDDDIEDILTKQLFLFFYP